MTIAALDDVAPSSRAIDRNGSIDWLKLCSAGVIVFFHAGVLVGPFMTIALGLFTGLLALHAADAPIRPFSQSLHLASDRLLRPFAIWAAFTLLLRVTDALLSGENLLASITSFLPPEGSFAQLWFLPFAFVLSLSIKAIVPHIPKDLGSGRTALVLCAGTISWLTALQSLDLPEGFRVFFIFIPVAAYGTALSVFRARPQAQAVLAISASVAGLILMCNDIRYAEQLLFSMPVIMLGILAHIPAGTAARFAAELSRAIYLVHVVVLAAVSRALGLDFGTVALAVVGLAVSMAFSTFCLISPWGRRLI